MPRKRVIYTLFYDSGYFMLSRNFRLQRAGDVEWLMKNYGFSEMSAYIDELMIVNVSRGPADQAKFMADVRQVVKNCFVPVCLGGAINSLEAARFFVGNGADKIVVNSLFDTAPEVVRQIADTFGEQCVIGGIDLKRSADGHYSVYTHQGSRSLDLAPRKRVELMLKAGAGEILVQSIDRDGTGQGFDFDMVAALGQHLNVPLILCGGCGKSAHMYAALENDQIDAMATANLFNFIGNGLQIARLELLEKGLDLPRWDVAKIRALGNALLTSS